MSANVDSKLLSVFPKRHYLDIVDEAWIADALSDDEIDVPKGVIDLDESNGELEAVGWAEEKVDRWHELALDTLPRDRS